MTEAAGSVQPMAAEEHDVSVLILEGTALLADSPDLETGLRLAVQTMARALGGARAVVYRLTGSRAELEVLGSWGGPAPAAGTRLPLTAMTAAASRVLEMQRGEVVDFDALPAARRGVGERFGVHRLQALPLLYHEQSVGILVVDDPAWPRREFSARELEIMEAFAAPIAAAVENARLLAGERARVARLTALLELSTLVTSTLDVDTVVEQGLPRVVALLGVTAASLWLLDARAPRLVLREALGFDQRFFADFREGLPLDAPHDVARAVATGEALFHDDALRSDVAVPVREAYARYGLTLGALIAIPLRTPSGVIGGLTLAWDTPQRFDDDRRSFNLVLADTLALALENARLFGDQQRIAKTLQENLLRPLPSLPGVDLGRASHSADEPALVGGDFSDAFVLSDGRLVILVGDVAGNGLTAAGRTETVRSTVRALAHVEADPALVLDRANEVLMEDDESLVTALLGVLDRRSGELVLASAGHPWPVHLTDGACTLVPLTPGPPLGAFPGTHTTSRITLRPHDYVVAYTDGVTEARHDGVFLGEEGLVSTVSSLRGRPAADVALGVADAALEFGRGLRDDVHVLVLRLG
ncbi:MAG TPA: SpoIIE family protein phosphatase [Thermoleophilia bacterium]|nr:SpoIIE family protein phosphatase [Thermoleophilia bacterium]